MQNPNKNRWDFLIEYEAYNSIVVRLMFWLGAFDIFADIGATYLSRKVIKKLKRMEKCKT